MKLCTAALCWAYSLHGSLETRNYKISASARRGGYSDKIQLEFVQKRNNRLLGHLRYCEAFIVSGQSCLIRHNSSVFSSLHGNALH